MCIDPIVFLFGIVLMAVLIYAENKIMDYLENRNKK